MIVKLLTEHHLECLSLKGGCRGRLVRVYTCQNATLLETSCTGSKFNISDCADNGGCAAEGGCKMGSFCADISCCADSSRYIFKAQLLHIAIVQIAVVL